MKYLFALEKYLLLATVFLFPFIVLSVFPNPYDTAKILILTFGVGLVVLIKALRLVIEGSFEVGQNRYNIPLGLLAIAYLASAVFKTPNKMDAFFLPGTATFVIGSVLVFFLLGSLGSKEKRNIALALFFSGVAASLFNFFAFSGILTKIPQLPAFMKEAVFTPLGGALPAALFFAPLVLVGIGLLVSEKEVVNKVFYSVASVVLILGLSLSVYHALPGKVTSPTLPPFAATWSIAVETLKESPIFGVGPGNYVSAFNRFRPITYNTTSLWPVRFTTAANLPLTTLTETGLLGLAALAILYFLIIKSVVRKLALSNKEVKLEPALYLAALLVIAVLTLTFPANPAVILLFAALASLTSKVELQSFSFSTHSVNKAGLAYKNRLAAYIVAVPLVLLVGLLFFFGVRAVSAEATFKKSLDALAKNDGKATYDYLRAAINTNPYVDRYHATYAQVNLALARSIAGQKELTDTDRQTVAQLIQQAIREGKATVTLNPTRAGNWEVLARTYQAIMPFAQGADNFTIQTFSQAVVLDPINPNLRIALGGVYYSLGRYDEAIKAFELATLAKPDLANAHYNLAIAYREKGDIDKAITAMNNVLSLVEKDSSDYQLAKTELDNLEKNRPSKDTEGSETLNPPQPSPTPAIKPQLKLPEESNPPEAPTPTPTP
jgi:tetratricopeptide (TPR) repeat protein